MKRIVLSLLFCIYATLSIYSQYIHNIPSDSVKVALDIKKAIKKKHAKKFLKENNIEYDKAYLNKNLDSICTQYQAGKYLPKSSGFYLKKSAQYQIISITTLVIGGAIIGTSLSSNKDNVRYIGTTCGSIIGGVGIGYFIANLISLNKAGEKLEYEMKHINAKIGLSDNGTGLKIAF